MSRAEFSLTEPIPLQAVYVDHSRNPRLLNGLVTASDGKVSLEHSGAVRDALKKTLVKCQQMTDTKFISVERRTGMGMELDFLCIRT